VGRRQLHHSRTYRTEIIKQVAVLCLTTTCRHWKVDAFYCGDWARPTYCTHTKRDHIHARAHTFTRTHNKHPIMIRKYSIMISIHTTQSFIRRTQRTSKCSTKPARCSLVTSRRNLCSHIFGSVARCSKSTTAKCCSQVPLCHMVEYHHINKMVVNLLDESLPLFKFDCLIILYKL